MSLKTWKEEFYTKEPSKRMTKKAAIEHSLQKWIGLRKSNLKKHNMKAVSRLIEDDQGLYMFIEAESCALCVKYFLDSGYQCNKCPLAKHLGESCDNSENGPYQTWCTNGNPNKMIKALKALLEEKYEKR